MVLLWERRCYLDYLHWHCALKRGSVRSRILMCGGFHGHLMSSVRDLDHADLKPWHSGYDGDLGVSLFCL